MKTVRVSKERLKEVLIGNREIHQADFDLAWDAYHEKVVANVEALLGNARRARRGEPLRLFVDLEAPQNHVDDYDRAIEMLEWTDDEFVELTEQEFQQYVQDDWTWKRAFSVSNKFYTGSESPTSNGAYN